MARFVDLEEDDGQGGASGFHAEHHLRQGFQNVSLQQPPPRTSDDGPRRTPPSKTVDGHDANGDNRQRCPRTSNAITRSFQCYP